MIDVSQTFLDGVLLSLIASIYLIGVLRFNPRLFLQDYPAVIQELVPPKTEQEKRQSLIIGIPFLILLAAVPFISTLNLKQESELTVSFLQLFLNAFGVVFIFNLVDLVLLDWVIFCYFTPAFVVIPGTEENPAYKDYGYHFRASLIGTVLSIGAGLVIAGILVFL